MNDLIPKSYPKSNRDFIDSFLIAIWFGLITGIVEGILFIYLQATGKLMFGNAHILWIAPIINSGFFLLVWIVLASCFRIYSKLPFRMISTFTFAFLTIFCWLGLLFYSKLYTWAIIICAVGIAILITRGFLKKREKWLIFYRRTLPILLVLELLMFVVIKGSELYKEMNANASLQLQSQDAPNVLMIVVDTLRGDHLSHLGYPRNMTPEMDRLAENGIIFTNAYSTSSYSLTSHVSLMTGKNNFEHGVEWDTPKALAELPYPTLAEVLRDNGYRTGGFSANTYWVSSEQGFDRGFIHFEDFYQTPGNFLSATFYSRLFNIGINQIFKYRDVPGRRYAPDINRSVLNWINNDSGKPYFVFINYMDAHDPYLPPEPFRSMFSDYKRPGGILNTEFGRIDPELTTEKIQSEHDAYDGAVAYADNQLGELVNQLIERTGDNLLVVITSDHGEAFGEHGTFLHSLSLYREEIHVPLIIYWPGHVPENVAIDIPVSNKNIAATIMELTGTQADAISFGHSFTDLWTNPESQSSWAEPLSELAQQDWKPERAPVHYGWVKSFVKDNWHYIEYEHAGPEIFDLVRDPKETTSLADRKEMWQRLDEFAVYLNTLIPDFSSSHKP